MKLMPNYFGQPKCLVYIPLIGFQEVEFDAKDQMAHKKVTWYKIQAVNPFRVQTGFLSSVEVHVRYCRAHANAEREMCKMNTEYRFKCTRSQFEPFPVMEKHTAAHFVLFHCCRG